MRMQKQNSVRQVSPINYQIEFEPNFDNFTFRGSEKIAIKVSSPTNKITLHAAEIEIKQCSISWNNKIIKTRATVNEKTEELTLALAQKINGNATISIDFIGQLNDKLVGFYRSKYKFNGKEKYLATTQFEAADARRAFPCWDEPEAKATFDVSLLVDNNHTAISNMPIISKRNIGKKTLYHFDTTPIMSTYLLYLAVGEFESISTKSGKTLIRIITTKGKISQGRLSLE